jgi:hypothetical protein
MKSDNIRHPSRLAVVVFIIFQFSCTKFVQVDPPTSQLVTASVFSNNSTATAAQTAIYSEMISNFYPFYIPFFTGMSGDELTNYSTYTQFIQLYSNSLNAVNGAYTSIWTSAYNYIYQENAIIEGLQNNTAISPSIAQQLTGESKFIRAFWNFYLSNCFGDIPLVTKTSYTVNESLARSPLAQVYQQIISDLKDAQNLLNTNFVDASDTTATTDRVRPTKWAAKALLSRVYLFNGNFDSAEIQSTSIINNSSMFALDTLNEVFLKNSSEAIWQLLPVVSGYNTPEGNFFILTGAPSTGSGMQTSTLSNELLNAFEMGDLRRFNWVDSIIVGATTYYYPYKYKVASGSTLTEYSMVLRLAEQYLIRAEARAEQGNMAGAFSDLNTIRNRAGLPDYAGNTDLTSVLTAILHERQVELFTEWGHRWLDLKRTDNVNSVMNIVTPLKGGIWNTNAQLYPIPQSERNNDPNMTQNPGY